MMETVQNDVERWLRQAEDDRDTAEILLNQKRYSACAFHCQQTAEKALKALLYAADARPWGHVLSALLEQALNQGIAEPITEVTQAVDELDKHYISARYPDAFETLIPAEFYTVGMAEEAVEWAETVLQFVRQHLP
ncbi:MAG: HEPN domain-containing protein [Chloroflexota bacterium]|nr:HEPN domain-containing protein [Chloroflexota bacterium]